MAQLVHQGAKVFDSPHMKSARLVAFAAGGAGVLTKLVELGLRVFGVLP